MLVSYGMQSQIYVYTAVIVFSSHWGVVLVTFHLGTWDV